MSDLIDRVRAGTDYDNATPAERAAHLDRVADLADRLMRGGPGDGGYTFANALNAACETGGITSVIRVAMVAERLARMRGGAT